MGSTSRSASGNLWRPAAMPISFPVAATYGTRRRPNRAPAERRQINMQITRELNERLNLTLTDAFCGFKAYRIDALAQVRITEPGYGMPIELWVQAAYRGLHIVELPVPLIYLDEERSFGGSLDDGERRLAYYHQVLDRAIAVVEAVETQSDGAPKAQPIHCRAW